MKERINPVGLKGNQITERMKELMGIQPINENKTTTSVVELTKIGPDGKVYGIVRENHEYYIKIADNKKGLTVEDFKYIGGLMNKKDAVYPSYAKAIKHLNLKFNSLNEAYGKTEHINVFEDDNLLEDAAGFYNIGPAFTNEEMSECCGAKINEGMCSECGMKAIYESEEKQEEGKKKGNPWAICTASVGRKDKDKYEKCVKDVKKKEGIDENITESEYIGEDDVQLSETEEAIQKMMEEDDDIKNPGKYAKGTKAKMGIDSDGDGVPNGADKNPKDGSVKENRLSISKSISDMDNIIESVFENLKKKV